MNGWECANEPERGSAQILIVVVGGLGKGQLGCAGGLVDG